MTSSIWATRGRRFGAHCVGVLLLATALGGCAKKDGDESRTSSGPGSSAGQGGAVAAGSGGASAGAGGAAGSAGSAGGGFGPSAGSFGFPPPGPVNCGAKTCTTPSGSALTPCCLPGDQCGLGLMGICQQPSMPGALDKACPAHEIAMAGRVLEGCCKPNGHCGVMSVSGLGCVERTQLAAYAGGPLDDKACTPAEVDDAGVDDDAGTQASENEGEDETPVAAPPTQSPSQGGAAAEPPTEAAGAGAAGAGGAGAGGAGAIKCKALPWWAHRLPWRARAEAGYCPGVPTL